MALITRIVVILYGYLVVLAFFAIFLALGGPAARPLRLPASTTGYHRALGGFGCCCGSGCFGPALGPR